MRLLNIFSVLSPVHIFFFTLLRGGRPVGQDHEGNCYYQARPRRGYKRERRWVVYKGEAEATRVPPEWHGWLHHQSDAVPADTGESFRRPWQKPHRPNLTGTQQAYRPPGHILKGARRERATGDYRPWRPPE
jgi:NADH:ubiquinone oxidoreductase subunit